MCIREKIVLKNELITGEYSNIIMVNMLRVRNIPHGVFMGLVT